MKMRILRIAALAMVCVGFASCEGCVRKTAQKVTELGMSAVEGVSDAISERGEETAKKLTDALGRVVVGTLKSIDEQLMEHVESVAAAPNRTVVTETAGNIDAAVLNEYYEPLAHTEELGPGTAVSFIGKLRDEPVVDAVVIVPAGGDLKWTFEYRDGDGNALFRSEAVTPSSSEAGYRLISYALTATEREAFGKVAGVVITAGEDK